MTSAAQPTTGDGSPRPGDPPPPVEEVDGDGASRGPDAGGGGDDRGQDGRVHGRRAGVEWLLWFAGVSLAGAAVRLWTVAGLDPSWWQDSDDYLATSEGALLSLDMWAGPRTVGAPLLLKLVGGDGARFVQVQVIVAALSWAALAVEIVRRLPGPRARLVAAACVVGFSVAEPLTMWDRSVLSESLALSLLALVVATVLRLARRPTAPASLAVVVAAAAWCATRDTHAWVVLLAAAGLVTWLVPDRRRLGQRALVGCAIGATVVGILGIWSSQHGQRGDFPIRNVYQVRVLPYPDRVEWFADHGMPQADTFLDGSWPPAVNAGQAPVTYVPDKDPAFAEWVRWVESEGEGAYRWWLVTHPAYVVTEPFRSPERTFNNAEGDRGFYAPVDQRVVPFMAEVFLPSRPLALLVGGLAAGVVLAGRDRRTALLYAGVGLCALALPHAALAWHADGMETARHMTVAVIQFHLGVLLLVANLAASLLAPADEG